MTAGKFTKLNPEQAKQTLVSRLQPTVDRLRDLNTKFGLRPYTVTLVWARWSGEERGEGHVIVFKEIPILPTPNVEDLSSVNLSLFAAGVLPEGSIRINEISTTRYTSDMLRGHYVPEPHEERIPSQYQFYWEVREDGRGDREPVRAKFRLSSTPFIQADQFQWTVILERISEDRDRQGREQSAGYIDRLK